MGHVLVGVFLFLPAAMVVLGALALLVIFLREEWGEYLTIGPGGRFVMSGGPFGGHLVHRTKAEELRRLWEAGVIATLFFLLVLGLALSPFMFIFAAH